MVEQGVGLCSSGYQYLARLDLASGVWVVSANNIWIVGDVILDSQDEGKTWKEVEIERGNGFYGRASRREFGDSNSG